jgi:hypothetical protein
MDSPARPAEVAMIRFGLIACSTLFVSLAVHAQSDARMALRPITSPVKDAGVYHVGLGTWTRKAPLAPVTGPDIYYANTCNTSYYAAQAQNEVFSDEGRVPSDTGPVHPPDENAGCRTSYLVNGFEIAYCTNLTANFGCNVGIQESYLACALASPQHAFSLTGLPGAGASPQGCWAVTIDLDAASQTFTMLADAIGSYPAGSTPTQHLFGWQFSTTAAVGATSHSGPLIAGHGGPPMTNCSGVDGTRWDTLPGAPAPTWPTNISSGNYIQANGPEDGRGMDTQDEFRIDGSAALPSGCYAFNGNPLASFHLRLLGAANCPVCMACGNGLDECIPGVAGVLPCPCGNPQVPPGADRGCNNSSNTGGAQQWSAGLARLSNDTLVVGAVGEKQHAPTILLQARDPVLAHGVKFGQGVRCINNGIKRLYVQSAVSGAVWFPQPGDPDIHTASAKHGDVITPGTNRHYMCYYRDPIVLGACAQLVDTFNASQSQVVSWAP